MALSSDQPASTSCSLVQLDFSSSTPGYLCGRLLATLATIQWFAVGNANSSLVDRFYGSASVTPRIAFPPLMRLSRRHLRALRTGRLRMYVIFQHALNRLLTQLLEFPETLSLHDQGFFALGYYHQQVDTRLRYKSATGDHAIDHQQGPAKR